MSAPPAAAPIHPHGPVQVPAKSPPSPSSDRDITNQLRSKSYSATPVLEPDSEVLFPDGQPSAD
ncbi:hypothetical protein HK405_015942, partial [Cladochytrium tenue]